MQTRNDLTWQHVEGESLALVRAEETVWRCHFGDDGKPFFHPLALPGGRVLTIDRPADHPWHHGLWFSWKYINGVNYWENSTDGRPAGRTQCHLVDVVARENGSARIVLDIHYAPRDEEPVLVERRVLETTTPAEDGTFAIEWDASFEARKPCVLDRTPLPGEPGGKIYGGYAGLSLRLAPLDARDALMAEGPVAWNADDRFRGRATAFDYRGVIDGREVGIAVFDHPNNPRAPTPWYAIRSPTMTFFTPALLSMAPLPLRAGDHLHLHYRILVHPGRYTEAELAAAAGWW